MALWKSIILGSVGTFSFGSEGPSIGCSRREAKIYNCGKEDLMMRDRDQAENN